MVLPRPRSENLDIFPRKDLFFSPERFMAGRLPSRELTHPPKNCSLKMIFLFPRWDMLIPWRVSKLKSERLVVGDM